MMSTVMENETMERPTSRKELLRVLNESNLLDMIVPGPFGVSTIMALYFVYGVIMIVALLANISLITVILSSPKMRTVTNLFLVSLGFSDLLIATVNMPFSMYSHIYHFWDLGEPLCKLSNYIKGVTVICSIITLTIIAVDRYFAVCHPLSSRCISNTKQTVIAIIIPWLVAFLIIIPQPLLVRVQEMGHIYGTEDNSTLKVVNMCVEYVNETMYPWARHAYTYTLTAVLYLIPLLIICVMYGLVAARLWGRRPVGEMSSDSARYEAHMARKKKVICTLMLIVLCFAVCWFPYFVYHVIKLHEIVNQQNQNLNAFFQIFGYLNCALNPIIYICLNDTFKMCAKDTIRSICARFKFRCACLDGPPLSHSTGYSLATNLASYRSPMPEEKTPSKALLKNDHAEEKLIGQSENTKQNGHCNGNGCSV